MEFDRKAVVITGGGSGIGAALARRMASLSARIFVADMDAERAKAVAAETGGFWSRCDVTAETDIQSVVREAEAALGSVDIFVSNAGIVRDQPGHAASAGNDIWMQNWNVHVMAHVYAARALLPGMIARGSGYFVNVASAAGLLNQIGDAAYSATKHAAVSFAESVLISHREDGIGVSVVCPQYVATPLIGLTDEDARHRASLLTADDVAQSVIAGVREGRFLILPHPEVRDYAILRATDHDRWVSGMVKLRAQARAAFGEVRAEDLYKLV